MRTAPFKAALSPMPVPAGRAVGRWLRARALSPPGLTGPWDVVQAVAEGLECSVQVTLREVARVLSELSPARPDRQPPGHPAPATRADLGLLVEWLQAFEDEVGLQRHANHAHTGEQVDSGRLRLWRVDDQPVAVAGHAPVVTTPAGTIGRVGPVYTPPALRRRGYGAAVTRAITTGLVDRCDQVMLFADAANPESNSIYEAMGFAVVAEIVEAELRPVTSLLGV